MGAYELQLAIESAIRQATQSHHEYVTVEHLLYAMLFDKDTQRIIVACGGDAEALREELQDYIDHQLPVLATDIEKAPHQSLGFRRVLERSMLQVRNSGRMEIRAGDILVSIFGERETFSKYLIEKQGITRLDITEYLSHGVRKGDDPSALPVGDEDGDEGPVRRPLERYAVDLVALAVDGKLDPLVGRASEVERMLQVLCRRTKNNPLLVGDPGVGKTAIVHGLAQQVAKALKAAGYNAYVITAMVPGKGVWHRVRIGAFGDKKEAQPVMRQLKVEGRHPILVAK